MILISLVLDAASAAKVASYAIHEKVFAHHVTIAYNPTPEQREEFAHLIGKRVNFKTIGLYWNGKGMAFSVSGVPSLNTWPHITVGCAEDVPPVYSNQLLGKMEMKNYEAIELELSGIVTEEIK